MQINMLNNQMWDFLRPVEPNEQAKDLENQNPNTLQNFQVQMLKEASSAPSSPTAQSIQIMATMQGGNDIQMAAQQQIRKGFLDIKI